MKYEKIQKEQVPEKVRFDVPMRNQGQIFEIAYGGFSRYEHDLGANYKRVHDKSTGEIEYFKLAK